MPEELCKETKDRPVRSDSVARTAVANKVGRCKSLKTMLHYVVANVALSATEIENENSVGVSILGRRPYVTWSQGKMTKSGRMRTEVAEFQAGRDGSGIVTGKDGTCLAVDFSGISGAEAMLVMTGPGAPDENTVKLGNTTYSFLILTDGKPPQPKVDDDVIIVGRQTIVIEDGKIHLGIMALPWDTR
jgi:hypothetical protein